MVLDLDNTLTARRRLLEAGKVLFARSGFDQTPTAAIAREAGTSESQLVRYYRSKAGLLEAIFNEGWEPLNHHIERAIAGATNAREALLAVFETVVTAFGQDHDLAFLLLFEGRRIRSAAGDIFLSQGFLDFITLLQLLIGRGRRDGTFVAGNPMSDAAMAVALMGAAEAMIRERLIAERSGKPNPFTDDEIRQVFAAFITGLAGWQQTDG